MNYPNPLNMLRPSATDMIRMDHSHTMAIFHRYKAETDPQTKQALGNMICLALEVHAKLEEEIFYPAMREVQAERPIIDKSYPEHQEIHRLIGQLRATDPADPAYDRMVMNLMRDVLHHVADEETTLLPDAEAAVGSERLQEIGARMLKRRMEIQTPLMPEMARNMMRARSPAYFALAAGALIGAGLVARRAFAR